MRNASFEGMVRGLACFFLSQSLIVPLLAQQPSSDQTQTEGWILDIASDHVTYKHWDNGRAWQKLTPEMRIMMVSGIEQGLALESSWNIFSLTSGDEFRVIRTTTYCGSL